MRAFLATLLLCLAPVACAPAAAAFPFALFGEMGQGSSGAPWLKRAMADVGTNPTGWSRRWCGRYMAMRMPGGGPDLAIAWKDYGRATTPKPGAVAVMHGHVGMVGPKGCTATHCQILSGNHSGSPGRRTVGWGTYPRSRIVAFRWP